MSAKRLESDVALSRTLTKSNRVAMKWKLNTKLLSNLSLDAMILPGLILVVVFHYIPMVGILIGFENFIPTKGIFGSPWVGLDNFKYVFLMPNVLQVLFNTVSIAFMKMIAGFIAPIIAALLLNEVRKKMFRRGVQTLIYFPHFLSWVILGGVLIDILSPSTGLVNQFLALMGIKPIFFLANNHWFPYILVLSNVWKEFGFGTIVYLAALTNINPELYEAASIDGAGRWKQTWNITLPGIMPVVVLVGTLSLGDILNAGFDQIFNLYSPVVYQSGDIIDTLVYRLGLQQFQYGVATAVGLLKSVVSLLFISISYFMAFKFAKYRIF